MEINWNDHDKICLFLGSFRYLFLIEFAERWKILW